MALHHYIECPNCGAIWGLEEIDWQQCDCCGWPENDEGDEGDDDLEDDFEAELNRRFENEGWE